jgi:tetratricopeptide (TPR) repeat protein
MVLFNYLMNKQKKNNSSSKVAPVSKKRILLFKVISILLPFLVLILLEISLRIFHYGNNYSLFIEYKDNPNFLMLNPEASKKYFTNQAIATTGNEELFKKEKDANTMRIFVLGESTTIGFPYFHNGSFHRWLKYRLMRTFPDKNFEIINLSLTAVNSYTVLGFAKEAVHYQPDAVFIYAGHNEYYGTLGVASTENIGGNPFMIKMVLKLRELKVVQLITNLYEKTAGLFRNTKNKSGETRMQLMVANGEIPYQSKLYNRGVEQFRYNMDEALSIFNKEHIPVFISNLVSNEKDLKPFISLQADSIKFPAFKTNFENGVKAFDAKDFPAAYNFFKEANKIYNKHALCNYYLGRLVYMQGDFNQAGKYFAMAKDLDGLRFRAPGEMNDIIDRLCVKYHDAYLVDTKTAFENWSADHLIGDSLILEHVHPNLTGYALISEAFYDAMIKEKLLTVSKEKEMSFQQLLNEMPVTKVDSLSGAYRISNLKKSWPFNEMLQQHDSAKIETEEEKLAWGLSSKQLTWYSAMDSLYNYYIKHDQLSQAKKVVEAMVLEYPTDAEYYERAAMISGKLNDSEDAIFYFRKSFDLSPSFDKARMLFVLYFKLDRPADALPYLDYSINNNANDMKLAPIKYFAQEIIQLQKNYLNDSSNISILSQIAERYFKMGNQDGASKYINIILKKDSENKDALGLLSEIKK